MTKEECKGLMGFAHIPGTILDFDIYLELLSEIYNQPLRTEFKKFPTDGRAHSPKGTRLTDNPLEEEIMWRDVRLQNISEETNMSLLEAYRKYIPGVLRRYIYTSIPCWDGYSCDANGNVRIIIYEKFKDSVTEVMNHYYYDLISTESFLEKNGYPTVIVNYKLDEDKLRQFILENEERDKRKEKVERDVPITQDS